MKRLRDRRYAGCGEGERGADSRCGSRSPGGTEGATVVIEPLKTGESLWPHTFFDRAGAGHHQAPARGRFRLLAGHLGVAAGSGLPRPPPERWATSWSTPASTLGGPGSPRQVRPAHGPSLQGRGGRGHRLPAARSRARSLRHRLRRPHPPARGPRLRDRGVPRRSVRVQRHRVGGRDERAAARCSAATTAPFTTSPSSTTRSTSTPTSSSRMGHSVAASTSSGMGRSVLRTRPVTARATPR